jgi:hypothetical protein
MRQLMTIILSIALPMVASAGGSSGGGGGGVGPRPDARIFEMKPIESNPAVKFGRMLDSGKMEYELGLIQNGRVLNSETVQVEKQDFSAEDSELVKALLTSRQKKSWVNLPNLHGK